MSVDAPGAEAITEHKTVLWACKRPLQGKHRLKTYPAQHNMKLNQLLFDAFAALKEKDVKQRVDTCRRFGTEAPPRSHEDIGKHGHDD